MLRFIQLQRGFPHLLLHFPENGEGQNPVSEKGHFLVSWQSFQLFLVNFPTFPHFCPRFQNKILETFQLFLGIIPTKDQNSFLFSLVTAP